jgi:ABC-type Mn2+/Zn2+ transport system permease subunit
MSVAIGYLNKIAKLRQQAVAAIEARFRFGSSFFIYSNVSKACRPTQVKHLLLGHLSKNTKKTLFHGKQLYCLILVAYCQGGRLRCYICFLRPASRALPSIIV